MVDLKNGIGRRCPWLMDDVCGKPCTTQSASCIADFKYQLLSGTDTDICGLIKLAKECIISKSNTCGAKQKQAGLDRLDKAIEGLNIPVNCEDGNAVQKCLISNRQAVLSELSQRASVSDGDAVCSSITSMNECIENEKDGDEVPQAIRDILDAVFPLKLDCSANLDGSCAFKDIKSATQRLLDFLIAVASDQTSDFEKDVYCSKLKVLEDYVSGLVGECNDRGLGKVLNGMQSFCEPDNGCDDLETTLDACVSLYTQVKNDEDKSCIGIQLARICLSSAVTGCTGSTVTTLLNTRLQLLLTDPLCPPIPQFKLATSTKKTIYLLEGGPSFPLSVSLLESPGDNAILKLTVKASNMASSPPKCRSEDDEGFQQIHVTNPNSLEFTKDNFNKAITFDLSAVLDGRVDGSQTMMVQIVADLVVNGNIKYSDLIAEYTVLVVDRDDKTAICSSINDPHVKTFDKLLYDNQLQGKFVLYKHQTLPYMVQVTYQKCAEEGTCNCRVQILSGDDVIDFNRCYTETDDRDVSKPLELSITRTGDFTHNTQIYSQDEGRRFYVLLPTGTLVQIRLGDFYMNVWITPSVVDKDHTEGLCGVYNGDTYDDLRLPNGDKYTVIDADKTGGVLTVNDFSKEWRVIIDSDNDLSVSSTAYYSDVTSTKQYTVEACGLVQGIDITSDLVSESEEYATDGRKKRAVANDNIDIDESAKPSVSEWPTKTGWTLNNATKFCQDNILSWGVTQKCLEAISAIGGKTNFETEVNNCVADIKLSGNTNWVDSAKDDVLQNCLNELNKDVQYLNNPEAKLQAEAVMSSSCNPSDCNGNGQCTTGTCICKKDYYGSDCSMKEDELPTPVLYSIKNNGECILSDKSSCTNVFISGRQFIQSEKLTCHIQPLEVTETGHKAVGQPTIVIAKLLTLNQISCKVSGIKTPTTSLHISISNNGKSTSNKLMYIAYNVAIHQCNALEGTCKLQSNLCKIGGQVYNKDESLPTDKCLYCNPEESQTRWSSKSEAGCEIIAERRDDNPSGLGLTETIIIGVIGGLAFFIIVAILIKFVLVKRNRRTPKRVDDTEVALPPSPKSPQERELQIFQNEVYVSSDDLKDENDSMPELNDSRYFDDRSASERCSTRIKPRINTQSMSGPFVTKIDIN
ncbi:hypothetical protein LOTGIDRAFT_159185 [Lottia gigantea]|uniref:VWFD domain-containing protein n=1 Tax=Lottia gigantea TaxID=225164 RepID=V4ATY6_LOTGI|nr:hypothetical protein LOTGIDRAFT_159185 [Lottia gigantea]ESO98380.1 hypothetical protein LOTGIDRAFT_159185 [Lottia gigantea]